MKSDMRGKQVRTCFGFFGFKLCLVEFLLGVRSGECGVRTTKHAGRTQTFISRRANEDSKAVTESMYVFMVVFIFAWSSTLCRQRKKTKEIQVNKCVSEYGSLTLSDFMDEIRKVDVQNCLQSPAKAGTTR